MKTVQTKILQKKSLTHDVIEIVVEPRETVTFAAGQFMNLIIPQENGKIALRSYSLANHQADTTSGHLRFLVKLIPGGAASEYLKKSQVGDMIEWSNPAGIFKFKSIGVPNVYFFATGTGLAPLMSMIEIALFNNINSRIHLFFGVRYKVDIFWEDILKDLALEYSNFNYDITLSKPVGYWEGHKGYISQFINDDLDLENGHFYLCGLPQMIEEAKALLLQKGVNKERIFEEKYSNPRMGVNSQA